MWKPTNQSNLHPTSKHLKGRLDPPVSLSRKMITLPNGQHLKGWLDPPVILSRKMIT